jgi:hypothetical protein
MNSAVQPALLNGLSKLTLFYICKKSEIFIAGYYFADFEWLPYATPGAACCHKNVIPHKVVTEDLQFYIILIPLTILKLWGSFSFPVTFRATKEGVIKELPDKECKIMYNCQNLKKPQIPSTSTNGILG